jgi:hypothetical protein
MPQSAAAIELKFFPPGEPPFGRWILRGKSDSTGTRDWKVPCSGPPRHRSQARPRHPQPRSRTAVCPQPQLSNWHGRGTSHHARFGGALRVETTPAPIQQPAAWASRLPRSAFARLSGRGPPRYVACASRFWSAETCHRFFAQALQSHPPGKLGDISPSFWNFGPNRAPLPWLSVESQSKTFHSRRWLAATETTRPAVPANLNESPPIQPNPDIAPRSRNARRISFHASKKQ